MPVMLKAGVTGKISGKITDQESGETIAGANIVIDGSYLGASSDLDGFYFIINIPPGTYDLTISVIGYSVQRIKGVKVITDQTTTINAELILTFLKGEEVTVFAERPTIEVDRTFSTSTVDNSEIEVMPITKMQEVIDIQAGVVDGHFRGGRKGEVAYLVDGISIQDSYEGVQSTEVNNSVVQELQVISGTFNAEYGQAMSGIVNMVTKEGALNYSGNLSVEYGDYISSHEDIFLGIDDISPMDDFSLNDGMPVMNDPQEANIANYEASLSGPLPFLNNISFFVNGRKERNNGWMNGENRWALEHPIIDTESGPELLLQEGDGEIVPMNPDDNIYLYGKLSSQLTPKIKLMYSSLWSDREYKDYDHYYKYIPGADYQRFKSSRTNLLKMVHSLNNSMFYDVAVSNTFTEYHHYVFEDPFDPQYVNPVYSDVNPPYTLNIGGVKTEHFRRYTDTHTLQGNFTWQANSVHLFKAGFKVDVHNLYFRSYNVIHDQYVSIMPDTVAPLVYAPYIPDVTDINHDYYLYHPYEAAIYLQDKIELESLIVNWGLRFDYFYPDGKIITDPMDPDINNPVFEEHLNDPLSVRETYWYDKPDPKMQVSPRIGIGYPISANGVLHFAYGHFFQRPKFEYMYTNPEFELEQGSGLNTVMGNADLAVERTVTYEFGLQQALSE
ncbi:MAG: TonB-dependent receptor, partial [FCB group bacterium]|nr:TonB-dependent receptor [FCB group bacterium]